MNDAFICVCFQHLFFFVFLWMPELGHGVRGSSEKSRFQDAAACAAWALTKSTRRRAPKSNNRNRKNTSSPISFKMSTPVPTPAAIGERRSYDGALCTVRYSGEVAGATGSWLGVEWDDPSRGKHDGHHKGVRYFSCTHIRQSLAFIRSKSLIIARPLQVSDRRVLCPPHAHARPAPVLPVGPPAQICRGPDRGPGPT